MYSRVDGSLSITVNFNNLTVEAEPEYLINNPGGDNHNTTITFQLKSAQKKLCSATISIYTSAGQLIRKETLNNLLCPGTYNYTWDGRILQEQPFFIAVAQRGVYPYNIEVVGANPYDTDSRCSNALKISQTNVESIGGTNSALDLFENESTISPPQTKVLYLLEDSTGRNASSAKVRVYNRKIKMLCEQTNGTAVNLPGSTNPIWNDCILDIKMVPEDSPYVFLVSAIDDHPELDKAHRRKPALPKNTTKNKDLWVIIIDKGHGAGDSGTKGSMYWDASDWVWKERYDWTEEIANSWLGDSLERAFAYYDTFTTQRDHKTRVVPRNYASKEAQVAAAKLGKSALLVQRASDVYKTEMRARKDFPNAKGFVFVSLHCNSKGRPKNLHDPNTPGKNPTPPDNKPFWRHEERGDKELAQSIYWGLSNVLQYKGSKLSLPPDPRIGRLESIIYFPTYNPPPTDASEWMVLSNKSVDPIGPLGCRCAGSLVECVTLTNYEDEDYVRPDVGGDWRIGLAIMTGVDLYCENH
jgi:N-acetylmuramoyl-L-alanine amidase